jgi:hypothetical protein
MGSEIKILTRSEDFYYGVVVQPPLQPEDHGVWNLLTSSLESRAFLTSAFNAGNFFSKSSCVIFAIFSLRLVKSLLDMSIHFPVTSIFIFAHSIESCNCFSLPFATATSETV